MSLRRRIVPTFIRRSYLAKFGFVLAVVILLTAAAGFFFYSDISAQITEDTQNNLQTTAEDEAAELSQWVDTHEQMTRMMSSYEVMTDGDASEIEAELSNELDQLPESTAALHYIEYDSGNIEASTDEEAVGTNIHNLDLELHLREDGDIVEVDSTDVSTEDIPSTYTDTYDRNEEPRIAFLSSVGDSDGSSDYALMVSVEAAGVADEFHDPIEDGYTQVVDLDDGNVMFAEEENIILEEYRSGLDSDIVRAVDETSTDAFERDDNEEVIAYSTVPGTDWVLVSHAPQNNAYALADSVGNTVVILLGIVLAGFVVIGGTIGRTTAKSLDRLATDARTVSSGDLNINIQESDRTDEIGRVQNAFADIQSYLLTVADQADAIARQSFDDPALEEEVPGNIGDSLETMQADLQQFILDLESAQKEAEETASQLQREANAIRNTISSASDGDFTQRLGTDFENEAMVEIAQSFDEMAAELESTIVDIQSLANEVDHVSEDVSIGVEEVDQASDEVSRSAEEISTATEQQTERFREVLKEMNDLSATIEEIASTSDEVASASDRVASRADDASDVATDALDEMEQLDQRAEDITVRVEKLDGEISEIGEIVDVIDDIAEQTNMLALNASIEAARASGDSEGFAVVADEIKSLAEETAEATKEVDELITGVQTSTAEAVDEIRTMRKDVATGVENVEEGLDAINEVADGILDVDDGIQAIDNATDEQAISSQQVVNMLDEATESSEETNAEAESVAAAAEEQTVSVSQISQGAQSLSERSQELSTKIAQFSVRSDDSPTGSDNSNE